MLDQARLTHTPLTEQNDSSLIGGRLEYARLKLGTRTEGFTRDQNLAIHKGIGDRRGGTHGIARCGTQHKSILNLTLMCVNKQTTVTQARSRWAHQRAGPIDPFDLRNGCYPHRRLWELDDELGRTLRQRSDTPDNEKWSGRWESNPRLKLGKLGYYHYTTPARAADSSRLAEAQANSPSQKGKAPYGALPIVQTDPLVD